MFDLVDGCVLREVGFEAEGSVLDVEVHGKVRASCYGARERSLADVAPWAVLYALQNDKNELSVCSQVREVSQRAYDIGDDDELDRPLGRDGHTMLFRIRIETTPASFFKELSLYTVSREIQ